jgi:hypothetical protein
VKKRKRRKRKSKDGHIHRIYIWRPGRLVVVSLD